MITTLLNDLLRLEDSTTLFLESVNGKSLKVKIYSQSEEERKGNCYITRTTMLFFLSPETPALYCISDLDKGNLTENEYRLLMNTTIPIGKLFPQLNGNDVIRKRNIEYSSETNVVIADMLKVYRPYVYKKQYDYWVGERRIGRIVEFFNEESLMRV